MNLTLLVYIFKRFILMIPTLLGILAITFIIIQFVPGGPVEQMKECWRAITLRSGSKYGEQLQAQRRELRSVRARVVMFIGEQADLTKIVWRRLKNFMDLINLRREIC